MFSSKYRNKISEFKGIKFHSKGEMERYQELLILEKVKEISNLRLQVPYKIEINGNKICTYFADFVYFDEKTKEEVVEDYKGTRTAIYRLKKKLVEAQYGIKILET